MGDDQQVVTEECCSEEYLAAHGRWEVVGGAEKGGILVREGYSLSSPLVPQRLSTNSQIDEVDLRGDRLQYRLVSGEGPAEGWVSIRAGGKELVSRLCSDASNGVGSENATTPAAPLPSTKNLVGNVETAEATPNSDLDEALASVPIAAWDDTRRQIRNRALQGWAMTSRGGYVSPPETLAMSTFTKETNPVCALGECADPNCGNFRPRAPKVRTAFADFCVTQIMKALPSEVQAGRLPMAYVSIGAGALYFDWELLERLRAATGVTIARIAIIDTLYARPDGRLRAAIQQFEAWFAPAVVCRFNSMAGFLSKECPAPLLRPRQRQTLTESAVSRCYRRQWYQVVMQCDAVQVDEEEGRLLDQLRNQALQPGGLAFSLSNPPERRCWQRRLEGSGTDMVDSARWRYPGWSSFSGSAAVQQMPMWSSAWFSSQKLRRVGLHAHRIAILRDEHPAARTELPESAIDFSDAALESLFGSRNRDQDASFATAAVVDVGAAEYEVLKDYAIRKPSPESTSVTKARKEKGSFLQTTGRLSIGKLGGKWVEELLATGSGGPWYLIFGPGFGLSGPILRHPSKRLEELGVWWPPPP